MSSERTEATAATLAHEAEKAQSKAEQATATQNAKAAAVRSQEKAVEAARQALAAAEALLDTTRAALSEAEAQAKQAAALATAAFKAAEARAAAEEAAARSQARKASLAETIAAKPATTGGPEQRVHSRLEMEIEVSGTESDHQFFTGFTENISAGGLFVATYETLPLGSRFYLQFSVPGVDHAFNVECEVRWLREYNEMTPQMKTGMGVSFVNLSEQEQSILNELLTKVDTLFYED